MKLLLIFFLSVFILGFTATVKAESNTNVITDSQINSIRNHCSEIQTTLTRLQQADKLLRIDRGYVYQALADKLMVPLNQRIASNQLDGSELVATTALYDNEYRKFSDAYIQYDNALSQAIAVDCTKQPTTFYDKTQDARAKRVVLRDASRSLTRIAGQYKQQFDVFRQAIVKENR